MHGCMDCTAVALNIEILIFSCIRNKLINKYFFLTISMRVALSSAPSTRAISCDSSR